MTERMRRCNKLAAKTSRPILRCNFATKKRCRKLPASNWRRKVTQRLQMIRFKSR